MHSGEPTSLRVRTLERAITHLEDMTRALAPFEQIKYFHVLDCDFSVETGELTPTLKARRSVIFAKYGVLLEPFYARG